jgi:hypothetical protein
MTIGTPEGLAQLIADGLAYKRLVRTARRELNPVGTGTGNLIESAYEYAGLYSIATAHRRVVERDIAKIEEHLGAVEDPIDRLRNQAALAAQAVQTADARRAHTASKLKI